MQKNAECSELREETKERLQRQARYVVSIEYKMVRVDIHRRPTSWNVRLCAVDDSPLCLCLVPLFFIRLSRLHRYHFILTLQNFQRL